MSFERDRVMSLFAKAANKKKETAAPKSKGMNWVVGDPEGDQIAKSVKELARISGEMKALEAKKKLHSQAVSNFAAKNFVKDFAEAGVMPETPMRVVNSDGDQVTYVVQDRGSQYALKDEQIEAMESILGKDSVAGLVYEETTIAFNRTVMAIPGVAEAIEKALEQAIASLVESEQLSGDLADELIDASVKRALKPGTLDRAAQLTGNDVTRLGAFIEAMGSSCTRYIKV